MNGFLISVEGIDGSGKSTIVAYIRDLLQEKSKTVLLTKEPGATALGAHIREILNFSKFKLSNKAEFLLFAANRAQHISEVILPALKIGHIVISDRLADSSLAYQGYGLGLDVETINTINAWAMENMQPDLTIYLQVNTNESFRRVTKRNEKLTNFELKGHDFFNKVINGYDTIFKNKDNVVIIDASLPLDIVRSKIKSIIDNLDI